MSPVFDQENGPSAHAPLWVAVYVDFTDSIIRSQHIHSCGTSQSFMPKEDLCEELLSRLGRCCEDLITRKDKRALARHDEVTQAAKRRRYSVTFKVLCRGIPWQERTFKSYQRQPLTLSFTGHVVAAVHQMLQACLGSYDKDFRCLDGPLHLEPDTITPPLSPLLQAMDTERATRSMAELINQMEDLDVRRFELYSSTWSVREPLDSSRHQSASRPTIETVLERGHTGAVEAADAHRSEDQLHDAEPAQAGGFLSQPVTRTPLVEKTLPRHFPLLNRSSQSIGSGGDLAPRILFKHSRNTSVAVSIKSERGTMSSPRVFPLVPRKFPASSRRNTISDAPSGPRDAALPAATANTSLSDLGPMILPVVEMPSLTPEDINPELQSSRPLVDGEPVPSEPAFDAAAQQPELEHVIEDTAMNAPKSNFELESPISLAEDPITIDACRRSSKAESVFESSNGETSAPPLSLDDRQLGEVPKTLDDPMRLINVAMVTDRRSPELDGPVLDPGGGVSQASTESEEPVTAHAPSTPALSAGSDSSPRHSVIITPTILRSQALIDDSLLPVSSLDCGKDGTPSPVKANGALGGEGALFSVDDLGVGGHSDGVPVTDEQPLENDVEKFADINNPEQKTQGESDLDKSAVAAEDKDEPVLSSTEGAIDQQAADNDHDSASNQSILEEASMIQLPSSPPMPTADDVDPEVLEASMIELPSSPTLGFMDETRICPEDARIDNTFDVTFYLDSSLLEADESFEVEEAPESIEVDECEEQVDAASVSGTVRQSVVDLELPHCADTWDGPQDSTSYEALGASATEEHRTSWYNEESSVLVDDHDEVSELPSSPVILTITDGHTVVENTAFQESEEATPATGPSNVTEEHQLNPEVEESAASTHHSSALDHVDLQVVPADVALPPSLEPQASQLVIETEDIAVHESEDPPVTETEVECSREEILQDTAVPCEGKELSEVSLLIALPPAEEALVKDLNAEAFDRPDYSSADKEVSPGNPSLTDNTAGDEDASTETNISEMVVPDLATLPLLPSIEDGASIDELRDSEVDEPSATSAVDDDLPHTDAVFDSTAPIGEITSQFSPSSALQDTAVDAEDTVADDVDNVPCEDGAKPEEVTGLTADDTTLPSSPLKTSLYDEEVSLQESETIDLLSAATIASLVDNTGAVGAVAVELPPSPEIQAEREGTLPNDTAADEAVREPSPEEDPKTVEDALSNVEAGYTIAIMPKETREGSNDSIADVGSSPSIVETDTESDIPSTTSELDEDEVRELDNNLLPPATVAGGQQGAGPVLAGLEMVAAEARTRTLSNASDLPSLFAPTISKWLRTADNVSPQEAEQAEDAISSDNENAAVLDEDMNTVVEADIPAQQEEQPAVTPFLTAQEIPDPFDQVRPDDSVSVVDEEEEYLHSSLDEPVATIPRTPRRQLTFPIPTPFSLRTTSFFPSPPSPAVSIHTSSPRSSFSSLRPSIDGDRNSVDTVSLRRNSVDTISLPPRDSVDTIAPLPSDSPPSSPTHAGISTPGRPSTAGWLGVRGSSATTRRFSMPLQHVWDPLSLSDRGSHTTSRPGTPTSTATVRYASYKRRGERRRPRLSDLSPRPVTSGGVLETVTAGESGHHNHGHGKGKSVASKFVMLFAGVEYAKKALGDEKS